MNPYAMAYAVGYYYGRSLNNLEDIVLPAHDLAYKDNQGFEDGLEAGRRDFQDVDLPIAALAQKEVDPE